MLRNWRENNPEKVRAQKRRHYEVWPQIPGTRQTKQKKDCYDPDEILWGLFEVCVELTDFRRPSTSPQPLPPSSLQRSRKQSSCSSSDSDMDEELLREMEAVLAEPKDPVKQRIRQIKKNRKRAEENRVKQMRKRQEEKDIVTELAAELDEMMFKLHDMGKWFAEFECEDAVEQASQFEYSHNIQITTDLMAELEQYLFYIELFMLG